jgi:hypothetical protein
MGIGMLNLRGSAAVQVLASPDFAPVPYAARYAALAARLKLDFGAIIFTLSHLPLGLRGAEHAAQRADVARLMGENRAALAAALSVIVARRFGCLKRQGVHDLMAEAVIPCVDEMIGTLVGLAPELAADSLVSRVFSQKIGVAQRVRLEVELARLIARLRAAYPDDSEERLASRLTLVVLGRDAMIGTIANSLVTFLQAAGGVPLNRFRLTTPPARTGVPYIDRLALTATLADGDDVAKDEVVRCLLQSLEGGSDAERMRFFGQGAHLCLGRAAALELFAELGGYLAGLAVKVRLRDVVMRDCDVFALPEKVIVEVDH